MMFDDLVPDAVVDGVSPPTDRWTQLIALAREVPIGALAYGSPTIVDLSEHVPHPRAVVDIDDTTMHLVDGPLLGYSAA